MFESLNKKRTVMEDVDTDGMEFKKLRDFVNTDIPCRGFFFTVNKFTGEMQTVIVTDTCLVNMPKRAYEQFKIIEQTPAMLNALLDGKLTISVHDMVKTKRGSTIAYELKG